MKKWKIGFTGASVDALVDYAESILRPEDKKIMIPFAGSGKEIPAFARDDRIIVSMDQQYLSDVVVNGVFVGELECYIEDFKLRKGYAYHNRMKDMPDDVAGLIDYIAQEGSPFERAALITAIVRGTFRGMLGMWGRDITATRTLTSFLNRRKTNEEFVGLPGQIYHHHMSALDWDEDYEYDVLYIDPPKVVGTSDIYSKGFVLLNEYLAQEPLRQPFVRWTKSNFIPNIKKVFDIPSKRIIFDYLSDTSPTLEEMLEVLEDYGTVVDQAYFDHGKRRDYLVVVDR